MKALVSVKRVFQQILNIQQRLHNLQEAIGRIENRQLSERSFDDLSSCEYRVFSQWGEDGIIQALLRTVPIVKQIFIEFGVANYTESNTRFLLINNNWSGLLIDGSPSNINFIKNDPIYWQYNLKAECSFITRENINQIFLDNGISGEIGILSIDIDGNDYWVWKEIDVVSPAIVIAEYNARFGCDAAVTVPYDPAFTREKAHVSNIYYGASLRALNNLAVEKGYALVGANSAGNNAFFVRRDLMVPPLKELTVEEAFVKNAFRESRDSEGDLQYLTYEQEMELLEKLPCVQVDAIVK